MIAAPAKQPAKPGKQPAKQDASRNCPEIIPMPAGQKQDNQQGTRLSFSLPASFRPADVLPPQLLTYADDARWLVDVILRKTANRDTDTWGCVRLHSDVLRRVMYDRTQPRIVRALVEGQVIETAPHRDRVRSTGYRLCRRFLGDRCVRVPCMDPRLLERIRREQERLKSEEQASRWLAVHWQLDREQWGLSISPKADEILSNLPEHTRLCQDVLVDRIRRREFSQSVSSTGRLFNAITGLKRELRTALLLRGEPVAGVDLVCAQPALLAMMLVAGNSPLIGQNNARHISIHPGGSPSPAFPHAPVPLPPDVRRFVDLAVDGSLYSVLCETTRLTRDKLKDRLMKDVLAKRGRYPSAVEREFKAMFPRVYSAIKRINARDHGELIRLLQRAESWLVVETVAPRILACDVPCITLHDSIFGKLSDLDLIEAMFGEVFQELGFQLATKRE